MLLKHGFHRLQDVRLSVALDWSYTLLVQNNSEWSLALPINTRRRVVRLFEPKNYTEKLIKSMQGKLRGELGSALPFLPGLFINYKLLRATFCYIAHLIWRLNMSPLIA